MSTAPRPGGEHFDYRRAPVEIPDPPPQPWLGRRLRARAAAWYIEHGVGSALVGLGVCGLAAFGLITYLDVAVGRRPTAAWLVAAPLLPTAGEVVTVEGRMWSRWTVVEEPVERVATTWWNTPLAADWRCRRVGPDDCALYVWTDWREVHREANGGVDTPGAWPFVPVSKPLRTRGGERYELLIRTARSLRRTTVARGVYERVYVGAEVDTSALAVP